MSHFQRYRQKQLDSLTDSIGVYALCDLDGVPIYVGRSTDGIRTRVRRHLTSARSDVIANRQIDVWEVAWVWAWPVVDRGMIASIESHAFHHFDAKSALMNSRIPPVPDPAIPFGAPEQQIQIMEDAEIKRRLQPRYRLPRQIQQFSVLLDYIIEVNDKAHLRRTLNAHFLRLERYYKDFQPELE